MIARLLAAALCAMSFSVPSAAAQSPLSDPYQAAQRSWQCRSVVPSADVIFDTDPWRRQPPAPADYLKWSNALASQAAWSVLYGYSLWTIDRNAPNGAERLARFRRAFTEQHTWWTQRAAQLASRRDAAAPRVEQESLILEIQALFEHSGLGISEIGVVQGHFAKQETNFCAAKARALQQGTR